MSIQNLIDELRKQLPGAEVIGLHIQQDGSGFISFGPASLFEWPWRGCDEAKTPDEAITLLRQRLGLEGMEKPATTGGSGNVIYRTVENT